MDQKQTYPEHIGKYLILGALGRGSMGLVFKAQDPAIGRFVAIKTVQTGPAINAAAKAQLVERLRIEARAAGNLRHPNIVTIFEVGEDYETPYLVMDYVEGETLAAIMTRRGAFTPAEALKVLWQAASALDYAHDKGVLHKDIKPANMLIDRNGQVMLLDFGIAAVTTQLSSSQLNTVSPSSGGLSSGPGAVALGTPAYMAPEQLLNKTISHRADLFSFGIVAFELFTGRRPFAGTSFHEVVGNILNGRKGSMAEISPGLPLALEAEFETALATKEEQRFGSAQTMIDAFSKALGVDVVVRSSAVMMPTIEPRDFEAPKRRDSKSFAVPSGAFAKPTTHSELFGNAVVGAQALRRPGMSNAAMLLIFVFIASAALGVAMLVVNHSGNGSADGKVVPADGGVDSGNVVINNVSGLGMPDNGTDLADPISEPSPPDKSVADFTDRQIMGVIVNERAPEALVKEAIDEAERRNLGGMSAALLHPLKHDGYLIRIRALELLGKLGDKRVVPAIMEALDDHDPLVRGYAARTLAALGDKRALPYLNARMASESVNEVKESLRRAIDKLNGFSVKQAQ